MFQALFTNTQNTNLSSQTPSAKLMTDFISSMPNNITHQQFLSQLALIDSKISENNQLPLNYLVQSYLDQQYSNANYNKISQNTKAIPLSLPVKNSLTDSLHRNTLGCQQKLAKSYLQILDQTTQTQEKQKQKRIQNAKKKFAQNNSFKDFSANSKPHLNNYKIMNLRPVIQNQHDSYMKTQLLFLQKPKSSKGPQDKQLYDKHIDTVTKKISQLGGMEDTIAKMQESLSKNEVKNFKKRSLIKQMQFRNEGKRNPFSPQSKILQKSNDNLKNSTQYFTRSRYMRENIKNKFNIQ